MKIWRKVSAADKVPYLVGFLFFLFGFIYYYYLFSVYILDFYTVQDSKDKICDDADYNDLQWHKYCSNICIKIWFRKSFFPISCFPFHFTTENKRCHTHLLIHTNLLQAPYFKEVRSVWANVFDPLWPQFLKFLLIAKKMLISPWYRFHEQLLNSRLLLEHLILSTFLSKFLPSNK